MKEFLKRVKNPGTIVTIVSAAVLILTTLGIKVDNEQVMVIVKAICSIGIALGVLNNPTDEGIYNPFSIRKDEINK
ncbi:hypothetical protein [Clostridium cylindrosporum]|uniref:Bacteriophage holin n=1 Tax=Clostridium cylindrosporum DSM 605 TaxID=1121307 RepID=A0A0J8G5Z2_CLOCY|nr:hypothetical protein [Clostridium cylindrosporum]KMT23026.1 bacteriophage holin [Clostridium cylindrosporum DSM 605]